VRLVVPWPAGGPSEAMARIIAQRVTETMKQQVIVDPRPGANTIIGTEIVAKSAPDGYTLLLTTGSHTQNPAYYSKLPYDTRRDFEPLTMPAETAGLVLAVHPSVPAQSVKQLVALAKARPGSLTYGSAGSGSVLHLAGELFQHAAGVKLTHVPYKGAAPALTDILGGHIDIMFAGLQSALGTMKANRLRALAQTGSRRSDSLPDLPTLSDLGIKGADISSWYGMYAPAKTPREAVERILAETFKAVKDPGVQEKIRAIGAEPVGMPQADFIKFLASEFDKHLQLAKRINLRLD